MDSIKISTIKFDSVSVDASEAGKGRLEIDSGLPILKYEKVEERVFACTFVPKKPGKYDVVARYNGIMVEGKPSFLGKYLILWLN